ncbi:hypothetical protein LINGRAHAP2_LOCUS32950, partial [Linum grandiflorum]
HRVHVQLDSRCTLQLIRQATGEIHQHSPFVDQIQELMKRACMGDQVYSCLSRGQPCSWLPCLYLARDALKYV